MAGPGLLSATLRSPTLALAGRVEGWKPLCTIVRLGFIFNAQIACTVNCLSSVLFNSTMGVRLICSHNTMLSCAQGSQCPAPRVGGRGVHAALGTPGTLASLLAAPSEKPSQSQANQGGISVVWPCKPTRAPLLPQALQKQELLRAHGSWLPSPGQREHALGGAL